MKRVTLRIPEPQVEAIEKEVRRGRFPNRSEAIRAAVRELLEDDGPKKYSSPGGGYQERDPRNLQTDGGLSISLEELEERKHAHSTTPPEQRKRCPECGATDPVRKTDRNDQPTKDGRYRCRRGHCCAHFDEPVTGYESMEAYLEEKEDSPEIATDGGQVLACPECDATNVSRRNGRGERASARTWHCNICGADFDEPNRRPPKTPGGTVSIPGGTGAAALAKMDPDDLVTDGGRDLSMELIEKAEEFDELQDAMLERADDDAQVAAAICDDVREICLRLADVLERRDSVRERFRIDEDEVLTDGGRPAFIPPDTDYVECYLCGRIISDFSRVEGLDISRDDEYYPTMVPICRDGNHRKAAADGGVQRENLRAYTFHNASEEWIAEAQQNIDHWGEQPPAELLLAIIEEVGEVADEVLETGRFDSPEASHAEVCLAAARDAGLVTQTLLEMFYEDDAGQPLPLDERPELDIDVGGEAVQNELYDLGALLYQLAWALEDDQELVSDGGTEVAGSYQPDRGKCPNCGTVSDRAYESVAPEFTEFDCRNENCRCEVFRVLHTDNSREACR